MSIVSYLDVDLSFIRSFLGSEKLFPKILLINEQGRRIELRGFAPIGIMG